PFRSDGAGRPRVPAGGGRARAGVDGAMSEEADVAFLLDVDNTLLDNDAVIEDLRRHLLATFGPECEQRYWAIFEAHRRDLGYADYLDALQRYRLERPFDPHVIGVSLF